MNPDDINKQINTFNQELGKFNKKQGSNLSGLSNVTIGADTLKTPQQPMKLAEPRPETAYAGLQGAIEANAPVVDQFTQNLQTDKETTEKTKTQALSDLIKNMLGTKGQTALTAESYAKTVDPVEKELKDINQKIREEQLSERRQIEKIQDNSQGLFGGAVQDEVNRIERESLRKQADLSVIQQGIQGRFDSAKAIADRAVQAQLEQQKIANEVYKINYEENKDAFTTAEKRLFETQYADRERKFKQEEARLQEISDLSIKALESGAPTAIVSAMRASKTPEEAIRIGGQYVGSLDRQIKQAQLAKLREESQPGQAGYLEEAEIKKIDASPQGKKIKSLGDLKDKMLSYSELVKKYGTETPLGGQKAILDAALSDLKIAYKTAAELGAIQAPDVPLIEGAIKPATFGGIAAPLQRIGAVITRGGKSGILGGIEQSISIIDKQAEKNISELYARDPRYSSSWYVQEIVQPFSDIQLSDEEIDEMAGQLTPEQEKELKDLGLLQ